MTFGGKYRGRMKPHESEKVMLLPMAVLSILAIFAGWFNATGGFSSLLGHELSRNWLSGIFGVFTHPLAWVSLLVAGSGIFLAYAIYQKHWLSEKMIAFRLHPIYAVLVNKFWVDELYEYYIGDRLLSSGLFNLLHKFDVKVIDGLVNGIARKSSTLFGIFHQFDLNVIDGLVNNFGRLNLYSGNVIRQIQNGRLQLYALIFLCGLSILAVLVILVG
jgi:NADH-quinone oxidoreductase subunit L